MPDPKASVLSKYMPALAAELIAEWIDKYECEFRISRSRNTKLGDYRAPSKGNGHKISVNYNLNQYSFLVTTVSELSHLITRNDLKHKIKPHGQEWKDNFKKMIQPFFEMNVFPEDIKNAISLYL